MVTRIILTFVSLVVYGFITKLYNPISTLILGSTAGDQFANSDMAYVKSMYIFSLFDGVNFMLGPILFFALAVIWFNPMKKWIAAASTFAIALFIVIPDRAWAFAETTDKTEAYTILPNESAFWIPDVGNNKDNQARMDSEQYLSENKIAAKRFIIPHTKFSGSGGWIGWDYYVPTGRLIIVDRTPYSREWVDAEDRGTGKIKEGFPCQSKEGINVIAGVSIGASVSEADAAKFLYRFGVTPPKGVRNDPQVIFTSVYYGRSLAAVMDDVGRKKVQTLVCNEIGSRTLDKVNEDTIAMMDNISKKTKDYFASVGITLDFIGWGDTFEFDKDIQKAINDRYAAAKLVDVVPVLNALAILKVQEGMGRGLSDKGLPIVVTPGMIEALTNLAIGK